MAAKCKIQDVRILFEVPFTLLIANLTFYNYDYEKEAMEGALSLKYITTQLGSLVSYLDKVADGRQLNDIEADIVASLEKNIKDWVIQQKSVKLEYAKPEMMGMIEGYISDQDYYRFGKVLETLKPYYAVLEERITRITGPKSAEGRIDPATVRNNVATIFDSLRTVAYETSGTGTSDSDKPVLDYTLYSIEAACEAVSRMIKQQCG